MKADSTPLLLASDGRRLTLRAVENKHFHPMLHLSRYGLFTHELDGLLCVFVPHGSAPNAYDDLDRIGAGKNSLITRLPLIGSRITKPDERMTLLRTSSCLLSKRAYKERFSLTGSLDKADAVVIGSFARGSKKENIGLFHTDGTDELLAVHYNEGHSEYDRYRMVFSIGETMQDLFVRYRESGAQTYDGQQALLHKQYGSAKCVSYGTLYAFDPSQADQTELFSPRLFPSVKAIVLEDDIALFLNQRDGSAALGAGKFSELLALLSSFEDDTVALGMRAAAALPWQECPGCFRWLLHRTRFRWMPLHRNGDMFDFMARKLGMYPGRSQPSALGRISSEEFEKHPGIVSIVAGKELADRVGELNTLLSPSRLEVSLDEEAVTVKRI